MGTRSDAQLVEAHLSGATSALGEIYDRYAAGLYDVAMAMTHSTHDAADLVQDTFVLAAGRLGQLRDPTRLRPWLYAVLRHEVYRRSRRQGRERPTGMVAEVGDAGIAAPGARGGADRTVEDSVLDDLAGGELAALVRDAADGLEARDRLVLELSVRQQLEGADLASALGVSPRQSYSLVHRVRQRFERSAGAVAVARGGRRDCAVLRELLARWDGTFDVLVRKRVARHVEDCDTCRETRRRLAPLGLFQSAPAFALPLGLRERVLAAAGEASAELPVDGDGFPHHPRRPGRRSLVAVLVMLAVLLATGTAASLALARRDAPPSVVGDTEVAGVRATSPGSPRGERPGGTPTTPGSTSPGPDADGPAPPPPASISASGPTVPGPPAPGGAATGPAADAPPEIGPPSPPTGGVAPPAPPAAPSAPGADQRPGEVGPGAVAPAGRLTVSPAAVDLGATRERAVVLLGNDGGTALTLRLATTHPFAAVPEAVEVAAGGRVEAVVTLNRAGLPEGDLSGSLTVTDDGGGATVVPLRAAVERGPVVRLPEGDAAISASGSRVCGPTTLEVTATVADESALRGVELHWEGPGSDAGVLALVGRGGTWVGQLGPFATSGAVSYVVVATDARGNEGTGGPRQVLVRPCPG